MAPKMQDNQKNEETPSERSHSSSVSDDAAPIDTTISSILLPAIKPHPTNPVSYISVSDPIQFNEGIKGKYTVYRVTYDAEIENEYIANTNGTDNGMNEPFLPQTITTQHRYSSFATLYNLLSKEKPGTIMPPLPDKIIKDRFSPMCLEQRRFDLDLFMKRCVVNPELRGCGILKSFFDEGWKPANNGGGEEDEDQQEELEPPKENKRSIKKWIKDKKTSLSGSLHRSPLDPLFDEMDHYVTALEGGLKRVEVQAEQLVKTAHKEENVWMEFGLGCDAVGHVDDFIGQNCTPSNDGDEQTVGQTFHTTSTMADTLSSLHQTHHQKLLLNFLLPLRNHLKQVSAAKTALTKRSNRRITYSSALSNVDSKKTSLHKARITHGMENKVLNAESSLSKAEMEVEVAKKNYNDVSERVLREFDRFRSENGEMMHDTMMEFHRVQAEYSREVARVWSNKIEDKVGYGGRCYVDAAKVLMEANSSGGHVVGMPVSPPPPVPETGLENGLDNMGVQGTVRYRDPLPEE